jgi:hypothetical protein
MGICKTWILTMLKPRLPSLLLFALLLAMALIAPARAENDPAALCAAQVSHAEAQAGIPKGLLAAISAVESGRWDKERRAAMAWPWTVTSGSNGQFFASKAEAIAEVRRMKAQGIRNIDVGCMQINLHHHAEAFDNLDEAFDPATNAAYAARFLRSLYDAHQDWMTAASHYHSATPELGARYRAKVLATWNGDGAAGASSASYELVHNPDWTLARPTSAPASPAPIKLASVSAPAAQSLDRNKARPVPVKPQPLPPSVTDTSRQEARLFANSWRQAKLAEYRNRKAAGRGA